MINYLSNVVLYLLKLSPGSRKEFFDALREHFCIESGEHISLVRPRPDF